MMPRSPLGPVPLSFGGIFFFGLLFFDTKKIYEAEHLGFQCWIFIKKMA